MERVVIARIFCRKIIYTNVEEGDNIFIDDSNNILPGALNDI